MFYRFISEKFSNYIKVEDYSFKYADLSDDVITDEIKDDAIKTKIFYLSKSTIC